MIINLKTNFSFMKVKNKNQDPAFAWEKIFQKKKKWGEYPSEDLIKFFHKFFITSSYKKKRIKVLDLGCGPGRNFYFLSKQKFQVYGCDFSDTALKKAKQNIIKNKLKNIKLFKTDIRNLTFKKNFFDCVIDDCSSYACSFNETRKIYLDISKTLKKNGFFFSSTFSTKSWGDKTGKKISYNYYLANTGPHKNEGPTRFTSKKDIFKLFKNLFTLVNLEKTSTTYNNQKHSVKKWIIILKKK